MIFTNARIIFPDAIRDDVDVVVREGKIAELPTRIEPSIEAIDLGGYFLAPGFVDLHMHGGNGHDVMEANVNAFRAICDYHASGGTTSLLLTTATAPFPEILLALTQIGKLGEEIPQIAGAHVEGPFISREQAGAQNPEFICEASADLVGCLLEHRDVIKRITIAPETKGALAAIKEFYAAGIVVSGGHSNAWEEDARAALENGMRSVTHTFNCMSSARRRGTKRVAGLLEFALSEPKICCELIAEEHHVSPALMKLAYCAKGVDGISLVTDATAGAGLAEETTFQLAGKKCIVKNGACFLADNNGALAGSASRVIGLVRAMIRNAGVSLPNAIAMASLNPAREAGLLEKGEIAIGKDADLVVLSPELEVVRTYVAGSLSFRAESRNPEVLP
ncbi:MAG: N-acetylglucosamine-6-phosphate deacetylase [Verrucomicrobia bacterium]|nr:MAG: N-acetylglucosamine-6-phosphate deacetylase [Verrucomicrobiota bacterium]